MIANVCGVLGALTPDDVRDMSLVEALTWEAIYLQRMGMDVPGTGSDAAATEQEIDDVLLS